MKIVPQMSAADEAVDVDVPILGRTEDYRIERLFRDVRLAQIYEGTNQIQRVIIARQVEKELA